MKIYLEARYSRRLELLGYREQLIKMGHMVTSSWLDTDWSCEVEGGSSAAPPEYRAKYAEINFNYVVSADCLITFTEEPDSGKGNRGGRHVELGIALGRGKRVIVVGHRENIFCHHPAVEFAADWDEAKRLLYV